jgi:tRNA threonylcarbamoyladenosine biosynthesis protein TsaB
VKLLALDSSTELCSAALWLEGLISVSETLGSRAQGELILPMVLQLLQAANTRLGALDAIAFGRGPGAFTGVRLATSVAQGLGFAAGLPLLPISDLRAIAARDCFAEGRILVCQDARMGEVYWGCFERIGKQLRSAGAEALSAPQAVTLPGHWVGQPVQAGGSGFALYAALQDLPGMAGMPIWPQLRPHAREIAQLAVADGLASAVSPERAQPVYLRDEVATVPAANCVPPLRT